MPSSINSTDPTAPPLLPSTSPSLVLTQATPDERSHTWSLTHPNWGPALTRDAYLRREAYLTTVPLARDGGITHWILTDRDLAPGQRRIYSSCETLRKRAVMCGPTTGGVVREGVAHGIGSVFTVEAFRGRGYAGRMMKEVGLRLRRWQAGGKGAPAENGDGERRTEDGDGDGDANLGEEGPTALFSVLYSDIGKTFYAKHGWEPFTSSHVEFTPLPAESAGGHHSDRVVNGHTPNGAGENGQAVLGTAQPIGYHELAELSAGDEMLLRERLAQRAADAAGVEGAKKTCVALLPDLDAILWHLMREDFMTKHIFGRTPSVKGAAFGQPGQRVWAVWTRGYYGGLEKMEGNTLHILRFVVEDENCPEEHLVEGFRSIIQIARAEAVQWRSASVQMWNPTQRVKRAIEKSGVAFEFVDRDNDSIASLMWYGNGPVTDLDWVANEKFGWC